MQGQKGSVGSLPESLGFEHGSTSSDAGVVEQQVCWTNFIRNPRADGNQETHNPSKRSIGESSSSSVPNHMSQNRVDPKLGHGLSSLGKAHPEPHRHEPSAHSSSLSLGDVNINPTHTHAIESHHGHNVTVNPSTYVGKKPTIYASSSSGPVEMEARHLSRKRKASDLSIAQSSSSNIFRTPEGSNGVWQSVPINPTPTNTMPFDPIIPGLVSCIGGSSSDNRATENIHRNVRLRVNNSRQQDQLPASSSNYNNGLLSFSSPYPSLGLDLLATTGSSSRAEQHMLRVPGLTRRLHSSSRSRSSSSRVSRSVASNIIGRSEANARTTPANISDHPLFVQPHDTQNSTQTAINWDLNSVGGNETNNGNGNRDGIASTSNPAPNLRPHRSSSLYSSRRQSHAELFRRSLLSSTDSGAAGGQNSNLFSRIPPPVNASASSSQETASRHLARTADGQLDGAFGVPYLSRAVAGGSERRGRLVLEMRSVLDRIRRGDGLRFEDFMMLDRSVFYGMADVHDRHRDMRLDVDNMSYEELLALEERIGNVNTGLTEENIHKHLKQKTYASVPGQPDAEPCCICQEEYKNGDDLGALDCGHEFHTGCIKQWLLQKNLCPVCKSAASK